MGDMRYISLFSGIEAATVAWEPLEWEPVCFSVPVVRWIGERIAMADKEGE